MSHDRIAFVLNGDAGECRVSKGAFGDAVRRVPLHAVEVSLERVSSDGPRQDIIDDIRKQHESSIARAGFEAKVRVHGYWNRRRRLRRGSNRSIQ